MIYTQAITNMPEDLSPEELGEKMRAARTLGRLIYKGTIGVTGGILKGGPKLLYEMLKGLSPGDQDSIKRANRNGFNDRDE